MITDETKRKGAELLAQIKAEVRQAKQDRRDAQRYRKLKASGLGVLIGAYYAADFDAAVDALPDVTK